MRIIGASLANRFYISDGWNEREVARLIFTPANWADRLKTIECRGAFESSPIDEPIYYAVYNLGKKVIFDRAKVEEHKFEPFRMQLNQTFGDNSHWEYRKNGE